MKKMRWVIPGLLLLSLLLNKRIRAQRTQPRYMVKIYEDNDFFNIQGHGTDNSYTNGTRIDFFYTKEKRSGFFIDRIIPVAGVNSVNTYGWGIMQIMVTPNDICKTEYQPNDYHYAGALYVTHTLYSYNEQKKYNFQTELIAGIRGPRTYAGETQTAIHKMIGYQEPMGWDNQLSTIPLINVNFTTERQVFAWNNFLEIVGGAQASAGTMLDAVTVYPLIRLGKMAPYFNGYFSHYQSSYSAGKKVKTQFYLTAKPKISFVAHNALLQGHPGNEIAPITKQPVEELSINHVLPEFEFGMMIVHGNFSLGYTQTHSSSYVKGLYDHNVGNLSFYISW